MANDNNKENKTLWPFEKLGFVELGESGAEAFGDCVFCGSRKKLYINKATGQWSCKAGKCGRSGNLTTFLEEWIDAKAEEFPNADYAALSKDRGIPTKLLQEVGIVWDGSRWVFPIYNRNGRLATLRFYSPGKKTLVLKGTDTELYGIEELFDPKKKTWPVWVVEGEWDRLAMISLLRKAKVKAVVVAVPGCDVFKEPWAEALTGRNVITVYDAGIESVKGTRRAYGRLLDRVESFRYVKWPEATPDKFDVRDFWNEVGEFNSLAQLVSDYEPEDSAETNSVEAKKVTESFPLLSSGERPNLEEIVSVFEEWLEMTQDAKDGLRVIYAVILAQQLGGDPLWVHICSPPGGTKTELLNSTSETQNIVFASTVTVHSLVSGWVGGGGKDPSLIPKIIGKTLVVKDFTEILDLPSAARNETYAIFRGAYDGRVEKGFGNGVTRIYKGTFNMLSGVTPAIFRENSTALGERFLIFHMNKGVGNDWSSLVRAAFNSVGNESEMRAVLAQTSKSFLEYRIERSDVPRVSGEYAERLINLAQLVAMLRANVERDYTKEQVLYRPQHEVGTRLAKQLHMLILALGLQNNPPSIGEEEFRITARVALDSCIGWNFDALKQLSEVDGQTLNEVSERGGIPKSTLRDRLEDLVMLGVLRKERDKSGGGLGQPPVRYYISDIVRRFWEGSGIPVTPDSGVLHRAKSAPKAAPKRLKPSLKTSKPSAPRIKRKPTKNGLRVKI